MSVTSIWDRIVQEKQAQAARKKYLTNLSVALYRASAGGKTSFVNILLEHAKNLNINDKDPHLGKTALHSAVINNNIGTARLLIQFDAKIDIPDENGKTVCHYAKKSKNEEIRKFFAQRLQFTM